MTNGCRVIMVGGFLGAGKTTFLAAAASHLAALGKRVGLITNDQAADLVDTALLKDKGFAVGEVSAGCFCCRFEELLDAAETIRKELQPDLLLCEPVGSCTDISATVLQPLKANHNGEYSVAPLSVLVDPTRLIELFDHENARLFPEAVTYILQKQLEEADLVVLTKADLYHPAVLERLILELAKHLPGFPVLAVSARTGAGMSTWYDAIRDGEGGRRIPHVDYDTYAAGEAALGWLNGTAEIRGSENLDWTRFVSRLLDEIRAEVRSRRSEIAHVKLFLTAPGSSLTANLTSQTARPIVNGAVASGQATVTLNINARVLLEPVALRAVIEGALTNAAGHDAHVEITSMQAFAPARPEPVHRFDKPVE